MANTLQIKRNKSNTNAPSGLAKGELAYTISGNTLYVGAPSDGSVLTLSDGDFVNGTDLVLTEAGSQGTEKTVTLRSPSISEDITLTFPADPSGAAGKIIVVDTNGNMSFQDASVATLSDLDDIEDTAPSTNDVLQYDSSANNNAGEWKHITMNELATALGYSGAANTTFADMIVNGDLIVSGNTTLDTADVLTKDKVVAIGVSGGIKEGVLSADGTTATVTSAGGAANLSSGKKIWVDGNGTNLPSGIYTVVTSADDNTITFATDQTTSGRVYHSMSEVTDSLIDGAGFTIKDGSTDKEFKWTKKSGVNNPYFELTDGNLSISDTGLYLDGVQALAQGVSGTALGSSIAVDAGKVDAELDGGTY